MRISCDNVKVTGHDSQTKDVTLVDDPSPHCLDHFCDLDAGTSWNHGFRCGYSCKAVGHISADYKELGSILIPS